MNQRGITPLLTIGLIAIILILGIALGYIFFKPKEEANKNINIVGINKNLNENENLNINAGLKANTNVSSTKYIDEKWNRYTNPSLGFSIKIPQKAYAYKGSCKWNETNSDHSYRLQSVEVPIAVFEDVSSVYISQEYFYELTGETVENSTRYYSECNKVSNSLAALKKERQTWHLKAYTVNNDTELSNFIRDNYGTGGCSLGDKTPSRKQEGVFDVSIKDDGLEPPESKCFVNYATKIKYYPAKNKVVAWNLGQDISFWAVDLLDCNEGVYCSYDQDMTNSFEFL